MSGIQNGQIQPEVSMVSVKSLSKAFGAAVVLSDINFNLERGKVHSIIGPNGAGKTTLLNILSGLYRPSSGEVIIDGTHVFFSQAPAVDAHNFFTRKKVLFNYFFFI